MRRMISASTAGSSTRTSERSAASLRGTGSAAGGAARMPPSETTWLPISTPNSSSSRLASAPAATRAVVSRALARSRMSRASTRSYLSTPTRSAWPGRGRVTRRRRSSPGSAASCAMMSSQLPQSRLGISIATGLPSVSPARTPESHSMWSRSIFIRAPRPYPCMRRASSRSTQSALTGSPAGSPSTRATRALPWDSPAVRISGSRSLPSRPRERKANEPGCAGLVPVGVLNGPREAATDPRRRRR